MEVGHDEKAKDDDNDADEFRSVVGVDAVGEVVSNRFVEISDGATSGDDEEADEEPSNTKCPVHNAIIPEFFDNATIVHR